MALALLDNWRDLPVEVRLLNTEATLHFASLRNGDFELARSGWLGDLSAPENFLSISRGASPLNYPGHRGAAFARLLEQARSARRRVGKEWVRTVGRRRSRDTVKTQQTTK